jgi:hypothetical protein
MRLLNQWHRWLGQKARPASRPARPSALPRRSALHVEALEDRRLLATLLGLTVNNQLVRFDSATPGMVSAPVAITGVQTGENILGIDFRPANGLLYGLGSSGRLYTINATSGAATQVGTGTFTVALNGASFGFDFNPAADRIRVVSDADQNLRLNPDTGAVVDFDAAAPGVQPDPNLAYAPAPDPNAGAPPNVVASAYTNSFAGSTTTDLFGIDSTLNILVRQGGPGGTPSPNGGQLNTIGALGSDVTDVLGFDIEAGTNTALAAMQVSGQTNSQLFTINLATGAAGTGAPIGGGQLIRGLTIAPAGTLQLNAVAVAVNETAGTVIVTVNRVGGSEGQVTVNFATSNGTAIAGLDYFATSGTLTFAAGDTAPKTVTVQILDDVLTEGPETFNVTFSGASAGAGLPVPTQIVTINDNEAPPLTLLGLTTSNRLVRFASTTPGTVSTPVAITGLQTGENIVGIDFRPATGQLFGLSSQGRVYTIDLTTGATAQVGTGTVTLNGTAFGVDFNPVSDRLRIVSEADQSLRVNPNDATVATDTNLAYRTGDPNAGQNPNVVGAAYSNSFAGTTSTTLYGIDFDRNALVLQGGLGGPPTDSPNGGQLTTVGVLGFDVTDQVGFDIAATGNVAFAALQVVGQNTSQLYTINLATGTATPIGPIVVTATGGGPEVLRGLALIPAGTVQLSPANSTVNENAGTATITVTRTGGTEGSVTVLAAATAGTATAGVDFVATTTAVTFAPGETSKTFTVQILDDGRSEANETVTITLSNATGGAVVGPTGTGTLTITDNDAALTPNQRFVTQAFFDLLRRAPDPTGLTTFTNLLASGASRQQVALQITSSVEFRALVVQDAFQRFLGRAVDPGGLATFVNALGAGATIEQVQSLILGSDEYFQTQGNGDVDTFLNTLFLDVLNRPIDPTGLMTFRQAIQGGTPRSQVAFLVLTSTEARQNLVQGFFQQFLGRPADPTGLVTFVNLLNQGARQEEVIAAIVGSDEYFGRL